MRRRRTVFRAVAGRLAVVGLLVAGCSSTAHNKRASSETTSSETTVVVQPTAKATSRTIDATLDTPDGRRRTYHLYVPAAIKAGSSSRARVPLLIALHGAHRSGKQFEKTSGFDGIAEVNRFVVVYPDGIGTGASGSTDRTWNGGDCCGTAVRANVDDVTFVRILVEHLRAEYPIDPARVFVAGHSNGGMLAYRVACVLADDIAAIGVQSTSLAVDGCRLSKPVSLVHVHGTSDRLIPLDGGPGLRVIGDVVSRPPLDGVRAFAMQDGCPARPAATTEAANPRVTIETWRSCKDDTAVEFVKVAGASHRWMVHANGARDSSVVIWSFLIAHPRR